MDDSNPQKIGIPLRGGTPEEVWRTAPAPSEQRGVTTRAIVFGLCIAVVVNILATTARFVQKGSYMMISHVPMGILIVLLVSILVAATLARWFGRRFVLSPGEWITVCCMGFVSAIVPNYGIAGYLVGLLVSPYYYATPENRWEVYVHPYLPDWLIPTNETDGMTWFYEGLPQGASIPWDVWALPLLWWLVFVAILGFACFCVSVIIHRQWADNERIVYPALTPLLEMTTKAGTGSRVLPEFMRGKAFWAGVALTSVGFSWNMIAWFHPAFPTLPTAWSFGRSIYWDLLPKHYPPLFIIVSTPVICFSYFASLDVLFSLWFFELTYIFEGGALNRIGIEATSPHYGAGPYWMTSYKWQTTGAFAALVLWWLWIARLHLRDVFRKALRPESPHVDDGREMFSYRTATIGLSLCVLYIVAWLTQIGIEARMIVLFLPIAFIVYLGVAKVVADSGLIYIAPPSDAWDTALIALGDAGSLKTSTRASYAMVSFNLNHPRGFIMSAVTQVNRLGDFVPGGKRRLFWGVFGAFLVGVSTSTLYLIRLSYTVGAHNFRPNFLIIREGELRYEMTVNEMLDPRVMESVDYWLFFAGVGAMVLLNLMRYRFTWWPFHPIGFALSGIGAARRMASTIFIAWLAKLIMMKVGGVAFYRKSRPFFIGMLVGYIFAIIGGMVVDSIWLSGAGSRPPPVVLTPQDLPAYRSP